MGMDLITFLSREELARLLAELNNICVDICQRFKQQWMCHLPSLLNPFSDDHDIPFVKW
jgi:hypothetical protein